MIKRVSDIGRVITGKTPSSQHPEHFGTYLPFVTLPTWTVDGASNCRNGGFQRQAPPHSGQESSNALSQCLASDGRWASPFS